MSRDFYRKTDGWYNDLLVKVEGMRKVHYRHVAAAKIQAAYVRRKRSINCFHMESLDEETDNL